MAPNNQFRHIPPEIIFNILSDLPIKLLHRFKSVSKPWMAMINHLIQTRLSDKSEKLFITSRAHPYSFYTLHTQSPDSRVEIKVLSDHYYNILGSCNGVLLLQSHDNKLYLFNPFTQRHRSVPSPDTDKRMTVMQGLGYDSSRDDFKVIWVHGFTHSRAYVYSSVSKNWKRISNFFYDEIVITSRAVCNGSPYWIVRRFTGEDIIVYFDPSKETFHHLPVTVRDCRLTVLGGNLCLVHNNPDNSIDVWKLKELTWSLFFTVPPCQGKFSPPKLTPLFVMGDGGDHSCEVVGLLLLESVRNALLLYNIRKNKFERIELPQDCESFGAACYVETLASP